MRKILFAAAAAAVVGLFAPCEASAQMPGRRVLARTVQATTGTRTFQPVRTVVGNAVGGIAESKSRIQAAAGRMFHPGGSMGSGTHEGVGFSTISPQHALSMCCYSNSGMPIVDQSVVRGANGWYATRIYSAAPVSTPVHTSPAPSFYSNPIVISHVGTARIAPVQQYKPSRQIVSSPSHESPMAVCVNGVCR